MDGRLVSIGLDLPNWIALAIVITIVLSCLYKAIECYVAENCNLTFIYCILMVYGLFIIFNLD